MFTPARMREVNLFIRDGDIVALSAALVRLGMLQVEEEPGRADAGSFSRWTGLAKAYAAQARRAEELLAGLGIAWQKSTAPEQLDLEQDLAQIVTALDQIEQAVDDWRQRRSTTAQEADRVHLVIEQLQLLAPLDVPVERLAQFERLHLTIGVMPTANLLRLQTSLFRIPFVMIPVMIPAMVPASVNGARTLVFAATTQENQPILDRALRSAFFEPVPLPDSVQGVPAQAIATLEQQAVELREHQQTLETERRQLAGMWSAPLLDLWKRAQTGSVLAETICRFPHQGEIYLIAGWVPAAALPQVVDEVQAVTEGRAIIEILEPDADRAQVPTLLQNPAWLRSFEQLVTNFGCPGYDEIDPTPLLAVSFLVMYGVMFGDIGHGLLLSLAGLWLMRRKGGQSGVAQLAPILVMAGLSAAFFGVLYGSVFGQPLLPAVWLKPMDNIMALLAFAVAGGVVLLNIGFVTNMIMAGAQAALVPAFSHRQWAGRVLAVLGAAGRCSGDSARRAAARHRLGRAGCRAGAAALSARTAGSPGCKAAPAGGKWLGRVPGACLFRVVRDTVELCQQQPLLYSSRRVRRCPRRLEPGHISAGRHERRARLADCVGRNHLYRRIRGVDRRHPDAASGILRVFRQVLSRNRASLCAFAYSRRRARVIRLC